jgi:Ni,Fe-hydrogenase III component G
MIKNSKFSVFFRKEVARDYRLFVKAIVSAHTLKLKAVAPVVLGSMTMESNVQIVVSFVNLVMGARKVVFR